MNDFDDINECIFEGFICSPVTRTYKNCVSFQLSFMSKDYLRGKTIVNLVSYNSLALIIEQSFSQYDRVCVHCSFSSEPEPHFIAHKVFLVHKAKSDKRQVFSE